MTIMPQVKDPRTEAYDMKHIMLLRYLEHELFKNVDPWVLALIEQHANQAHSGITVMIPKDAAQDLSKYVKAAGLVRQLGAYMSNHKDQMAYVSPTKSATTIRRRWNVHKSDVLTVIRKLRLQEKDIPTEIYLALSAMMLRGATQAIRVVTAVSEKPVLQFLPVYIADKLGLSWNQSSDSARSTVKTCVAGICLNSLCPAS